MNREVTFEKAAIIDIKLGIAAGSYQIKLVAAATAKVARAIGAPWLLDKYALVRGGFSLAKCDYVFGSATLKHVMDKSSLEVLCDKISLFKVFRTGDGKKQAKRLMISFTARTTVPVFLALEHWMKVGEAPGLCTIVPMQSELFDGAKPEAKAKPAKKRSTAVAKADEKKAARGAKLALNDGVDRRLGRKKAKGTEVRLTGPDGEVLFEGSREEFTETARSVAAGKRDPLLV